MKKRIEMPHLPFYFVRHGETDWNRVGHGFCNDDDIPLNETGLLQATEVCKELDSLNIAKICSSPLKRARQTAEIIKNHLGEVSLEFYPGLGRIMDETIETTFAEILEISHTALIVSHGEVFRKLLRLLAFSSAYSSAKNCGLYLFRPPSINVGEWSVFELNDKNL